MTKATRARAPHINPNPVTLAERLWLILDEKNLPQSTMAELLGISRGSLHALLHGPTKSIKTTNASTIERTLGYRMQWVVSGEGPKLVDAGSLPTTKPQSEEERLMRLFYTLPPEARVKLIAFAHRLAYASDAPPDAQWL